MAECIIDREKLRNSVTEAAKGMAIESGTFVEEGNLLTPVDPTDSSTYSVVEEINSLFQDDVISPSQEQEGAFEVLPSEELIDAYEAKYADEITAQEQVTERTGDKPTLAPSNQRVVDTIMNFLEDAGVQVEEVNNIQVEGETLGLEGVAFPLKSLIQHVTGSENTVLTEEAMHIAVELLSQRNKPLFNSLIQSVTKFPIYKRTLAELRDSPQYKNPNGSVNINKIKKEAVGKLLTQAVVNKQEIPEVTTFWGKIKQFLKNLFSPLSAQFEKYRQAVDTIFQSDMGTVRDTLLQSEQYLRENGVLEEDIPRIISLAQSDLTDAELRVAIQDFVPNMAYFKTSPTVESKVKSLKRALEKVTVDNKGTVRFGERVVPLSDLDISLKRLNQKMASSNPLFNEFEGLLKNNSTSENHKNLQEILSSVLDNEGYLLDNLPTFDNKDQEYQDLARAVTEKLAWFPEGTKFLTNLLVADERASATIDILAIDPSETFHILNYQDVNLETNETIDPSLSYALRGKVEAVRDILGRGYGINKFGQSRTLLINDNPQTNSLEATALETEYWNYLAPIPTESETMGSGTIDGIYREMYNINEKKQTVGPPKTLRELQTNRTLGGLLSSFRAIQISRNLAPITRQMNELAKRMQALSEQYKREIEGKNLSATSKKVQNYIKDVATHLAIYDNMSKMSAAASQINNANREGRKVFTENGLRGLSHADHEMRTSHSELLTIGQTITDSFVARPNGIRGILNAELIQMWLPRLFRTSSMSTQATIATLHQIIAKAQGTAELTHSQNITKIKALKSRYTKWMKDRGLTAKNGFDIITQKSDDGKYIHRLIDKIDKTFYDQAKVALQNNDIKWVNDNINLKEYDAWFQEAKDLEFMRIDTMTWNDPEISEDIMRKELQEQWLNRYDLSRGLNSTNTRIYHFPQEANHLSTEYKNLLKKGNEPALELYNYMQDLNNRAVDAGVMDNYMGKTFIPFAQKGVVEKMLLGGPSLAHMASRKFRRNEDYVVYGDWSPDSSSQRRIPFNLIYDISKRTFNEQTGEVEHDYSNVSTDMFSLLAAYSFEIEKYKNYSEVEDAAFMLQAVENNKMSIATDKVSGKPSEGGGLVENIRNKEDLDRFVLANMYGVSRDNFDIDGQIAINLNKASKAINKVFGRKVLREDLPAMEASVRKILDASRDIFVFRALGAAVSPAIVNLFGTNIQATINSGKHFLRKEFVANGLSIFGKKLTNKIARKDQIMDLALLDYFNILVDNEGNVSGERGLNMNALQAIDPARDIFFLLRESDKPAQYGIGISYIKNTMIEDGKLVNIREYLRSQPKYLNRFEGTTEQINKAKAEFEQEVQTLKDTRALDKIARFNSDGRLEIPGIERVSNTVVETRELIQQLAKDSTGMGTLNEHRLWNANYIQRNLFTFFSWAPRLIEKRFAGLRYTTASQGYEWGRIRTTANAIKTWIDGTGTNLINYITLNEKGVAALKEQFQKQVEAYENKTGKQYYERGNSEALNRQLAENDFMEMYSRNLKQQLAELAIMGSIFGILMAALTLTPDDDDELKGVHKFSIKVLRKALSEITFFYNPLSIADLTNGKAFPGVVLIKDFVGIVDHTWDQVWGWADEDGKAMEEAKPLSKLMKATPVLSQVAPLIAIFQQDIAKQLDYELPDPHNPPDYNR